MKLARRSVLGLAPSVLLASAAAAGAEPLPSSASVAATGPRGEAYAAALTALRGYALAELQAIGLPGMTLSVVDDAGFAAHTTFGYADLDLKTPVTAGHVFQIGSISKAFATLCLFTFAEEGRLDLDAPLARYLPEAALPAEPITVAQVMNHCAGLADGAPIFPRSPGGRLWCGAVPGAKFSYSNTGYTLLGMLIERLAGAPHPEAIRKRVLAPLGLEGVFGVIEDRERHRYPNSYSSFRPTWPTLTRSPLASGPWTQIDGAAGSLSATAATMGGYLRFLIRLGRGDGAPLFGPALAKRFVTPAIDADAFGPDARYGYGLATTPVGGQPCLHHTGGMQTFTSSFHVDVAAGVACFASVNASLGEYRPRRTTAFAIQLLRAAKAAQPLPPAPDPLAGQAIKTPEVFLGDYDDGSNRPLRIVRQGSGLVLVAEGVSGRLEPAGATSLVTDHPLYAAHPLDFEPAPGAPATSLWWGERWFGRSGGGSRPTPSAALARLAGHFVSNDPWVGDARILVRGDTLVLEGRGPLTERPGGYWALADDAGGIERLWFEAPLNGQPQRLVASGSDLIRFEDSV